MKIKTKIAFIYILLAIFVTTVFTAAFINEMHRKIESNIFDEMAHNSDQIARNYDSQINNMEYVTTFLLSNMDALVAMNTLSRKNALQSSNGVNCMTSLQEILYSYYTQKYYYRVNYFNENGIFLTSNYKIPSIDNYNSAQVKTILESKYPLQSDFSIRLLSDYNDPWSLEQGQKVFGLIRKIRGQNQGYIEVQVLFNELKNIAKVSGTYPYQVVIVGNDGKTIYSSMKSQETDKMIQITKNARNTFRINQDGYLIAGSKLSSDSAVVLVTLDGSYITSSMKNIFMLILAMVSVVLLCAFVYIIYFANWLSKPIVQLKKQMASTEISNMNSLVKEDFPIDEIAALNKGYNKLMVRLKEGLAREKSLVALQIKTNFDALQAQVNPHFINNVLNVISKRGAENGDESICDICDSLSKMLRYSTNTKQRMVTINEELNYVTNYLGLTKARFGDKLIYKINIDNAILKQKVPKIILQQIVENSLTHGFSKAYDIMQIGILGWKENNWWYITVEDNGQGFSKEILQDLEEAKCKIRDQIHLNHKVAEMEIGGMGLMNSYARMSLLFGQNFVFDFSNTQNGAKVVIGALMDGGTSL